MRVWAWNYAIIDGGAKQTLSWTPKGRYIKLDCRFQRAENHLDCRDYVFDEWA
jgi:hypothetical protein